MDAPRSWPKTGKKKRSTDGKCKKVVVDDGKEDDKGSCGPAELG